MQICPTLSINKNCPWQKYPSCMEIMYTCQPVCLIYMLAHKCKRLEQIMYQQNQKHKNSQVRNTISYWISHSRCWLATACVNLRDHRNPRAGECWVRNACFIDSTDALWCLFLPTVFIWCLDLLSTLHAINEDANAENPPKGNQVMQKRELLLTLKTQVASLWKSSRLR